MFLRSELHLQEVEEEEEEGERARMREEEEGSRHIQLVVRENRHWISLPGLLWPAVPWAGWPDSVCLALVVQGVHLQDLWKMERDMVRQKQHSVVQIC